MSLREGRWAAGLTVLFASACFSQDPRLCAACHGPGGNSSAAGVPSIAAQPKAYLEQQLILYREGLRVSDAMYPVAKNLKDAEIVRLAAHFSSIPLKPAAAAAGDPALLKAGARKAKQLRCNQCHGADYAGQAQIPRLAGQREDYLEPEMRAYRDGKRPWGDSLMVAALYGVKDHEIRALAHFLSRSIPRAPAR